MGFISNTLVVRNDDDRGFVSDFHDSYNKGRNKLIELLFRDGDSKFALRCDFDQRFLIANNDIVKAPDLQEGMILKGQVKNFVVDRVLFLEIEASTFSFRDSDTFYVSGLIVKGDM